MRQIIKVMILYQENYQGYERFKEKNYYSNNYMYKIIKIILDEPNYYSNGQIRKIIKVMNDLWSKIIMAMIRCAKLSRLFLDEQNYYGMIR